MMKQRASRSKQSARCLQLETLGNFTEEFGNRTAEIIEQLTHLLHSTSFWVIKMSKNNEPDWAPDPSRLYCADLF